MSFKQKHIIEKVKLQELLKKLMNDSELELLELNYQDSGSTGGVFRISIVQNSEAKELILKRIETEDKFYIFYKDILEKYKLSHPKIYGELVDNTEKYLVMEVVNDIKHEWGRDDYFKAIEWLSKKDLIIKDHIDAIQEYPEIGKKKNWLNEMENERELILKSIPVEISNLFRDIKPDKVLEISSKVLSELKQSNLTLVHNDFCKNNILINDKNLYVIDWVGPFVGSIAFDLAELLNNSPTEYRNEMLQLYVTKTKYADVETLITSAQINSRIGQIIWRIKRVMRGDDKLEEVALEIHECLKEIQINSLN